jgi:hypothetical protein
MMFGAARVRQWKRIYDSAQLSHLEPTTCVAQLDVFELRSGFDGTLQTTHAVTVTA